MVQVLSLAPAQAKGRNGVCSGLAEAASDPGRALVQETLTRTVNGTRKHGFDYPGLQNAVEAIAKRDPVFQELTKLFDQRNYTFAVDMHGTDRLAVLRDGIKNQFQTGTSGGALSEERRNFVESEYLQIPYREYVQMSADLKPKSMYLSPLPGSGLKHPYTLYAEESYGQGAVGDTWLMKLDQIEPNTLYLVGDSLDRALVQRELAADDLFFYPNFDLHMDGSDPMDYLLPLQWLKTTIPFYYEQVARSREFRFVSTDRHQQLHEEMKKELGHVTTRLDIRLNHATPTFDEAFFNRFPELKAYSNLFMAPQGNYCEGLYYGKLGPEKIAGLIYRSNPPSEAEWKMLNALGIQVYDGSGSQVRAVQHD